MHRAVLCLPQNDILCKRLKNLTDLLKDHVRQLLSSEQQLLKAMPQIAQKANAKALKKDIASYMAVKEENLARLKESFTQLDLAQRGPKSELVAKLIEDCTSSAEQTAEPKVADASLISKLQQINHLGIAHYGTAASFARTLGKENVASLLHSALEEEKKTDNQLSLTAEEMINPAAVLV